MISHNTSNSSFGNRKIPLKEKDYELLHYFDDQSDNESYQEKSKNKTKKNDKDSINSNNLYSSSENESNEDNFFECDKDQIFDTNEKVIEKSPDGNYGKVNKNIFNIEII